jgi:hypothetical protein
MTSSKSHDEEPPAALEHILVYQKETFNGALGTDVR